MIDIMLTEQWRRGKQEMQKRGKKQMLRLILGVILVPLISLALLSGCGLAKEIDMESIAAELVDVLNSKDPEALVKMLSPFALENSENLEAEAAGIMSIIDEEITDYKYKGAGISLSSKSESEKNELRAERRGYIIVRTSLRTEYRIDFAYEIIRKGDKEERGILYIEIE